MNLINVSKEKIRSYHVSELTKEKSNCMNIDNTIENIIMSSFRQEFK